MSLATLIRNMIAAGATPEAIALAVEAIEARDEAEKARRARVAERKRQQRARDAEDMSVTVTGQSQDSPETVAVVAFPAPAFPPNPLSTPTHTRERDTPRTRGTRITEDWQPTRDMPPDLAEAVALWPPGRMDRALAEFRDHWLSTGKNNTKRDWDRAFWNRLRTLDDHYRNRQRRTDSPSTGKPRLLAERFAERAARMG